MKTIVCPACDGAGWKENHTCDRCHGTGNVRRPETNGDRIRAMGDEELANALMHHLHVTSELIPFCVWNEKCDAMLETEDGIPDSMCVACMLNWLRQIVEGD